MFSQRARLFIVAAYPHGCGIQPGSDLHKAVLHSRFPGPLFISQSTPMSLPAHPRRAAVLVPLALSALFLSAFSAHADIAPKRATLLDAHGNKDVVVATASSLLSVPEPGVLVSLVGGVGVLLGLQRFRWRG